MRPAQAARLTPAGEAPGGRTGETAGIAQARPSSSPHRAQTGSDTASGRTAVPPPGQQGDDSAPDRAVASVEPGTPFAADRLFAPQTRLSSGTIAALVDHARAQTGNPQFDGAAGRRPAGTGLWLAWNDAADAPVVAPSGGVLLLAAEDGAARIGVARDSATGAVVAWDMEAGAPWVDADGDPVDVVEDALARHGDADGLSPLELATAQVLATEVQALAEADEESLAGRTANLALLLEEMARTDHPLFDLLGPYRAAVEQALPLIAGASRWARAGERDAARQVLDRFLGLLRIGLDEPARLAEIVDPDRARWEHDPTRVGASQLLQEAGSATSEEPWASDGEAPTWTGEAVTDAEAGQLGFMQPTESGLAAPDAATSPIHHGDRYAADLEGEPAGRDEVGRLILDTDFALDDDTVEAWISRAGSTDVDDSLGSDAGPIRGLRAADDHGAFIVWDEASDAPQVADNGGHLVGVTTGPSGRYAVVRHTRLNLLQLWDLANGRAYADSDGNPVYLQPLSGLSHLLPVEYLAQLQDGVLSMLAFAHAGSRDEQRAAILNLQSLSASVSDRGVLYEPMAEWLHDALRRLNAAHVDPWITGPEGELHPETSASLERWAVSALSPRYLGAVLSARSMTDPRVADGLFEQLRRTSGVEAVATDPAGSIAFRNQAGATLFTLPRNSAVAFLTRGDGAPILAALADWRAGITTDEEMAHAFLRLIPAATADDMTLDDAVQSIREYSEALEEGGESLQQASALLAAMTVAPAQRSPDAGDLGVMGDILLFVAELAPFAGNVLSANAAAEDLREMVAALEAGDYNSAAVASGFLLLNTIGAIPGIGTLVRLGIRAVRRMIWAIPGVDRAFISRASQGAAKANRLPDVVDQAKVAEMSTREVRRLQLAVNKAIGEAAEVYAAMRLNTLTRRISQQVPRRVPSGGRRGRTTYVDIETTPTTVGSFLDRLGRGVPAHVIYEIKTGASRVSRNQSEFGRQFAQSAPGNEFQVLRVQLKEIPTETLHDVMGTTLRRYFSEAETLELLQAMKHQLPDLRLVDLTDNLARIAAQADTQIHALEEVEAAP